MMQCMIITKCTFDDALNLMMQCIVMIFCILNLMMQRVIITKCTLDDALHDGANKYLEYNDALHYDIKMHP